MRHLYTRAMRGIRRQVASRLDLTRKPDGRFALWLRSLLSIYDSADLALLDVPWWTFSAIDFVQRLVDSRGGRVRAFEYGSGASTVWLSRRCAEVITVEHDVPFSKIVEPMFAAHPNIRMELVPPQVPTGPVFARSRRQGYESYSFDNYVSAIDRHEGQFDIVVIDGRSRIHCLDKAKGRLAQGGIIVFDNSNRGEYREAIVHSGLVERIMWGLAPALPYPSQTSILRAE